MKKISDPHDLALAGMDFGAKEAMRCEHAIRSNSNDLETRTKLLGYYSQRSYVDSSALRRRVAHSVWVIRNRPGAVIAGLPFCGVESTLAPSAYRRMKELWDKQVRQCGDDINVLSNAAHFYVVDEKRKAAALLKRLQRLDTGNSKWSERLGHLYHLQSLSTSGRKRKQMAAARAVEQWEAAVALCQSDEERFYMLTYLAPVVVDAGFYNKAVRYAHELIKRSQNFRANWNHGNAIHAAHITLGRVALRGRQTQDAKTHLIQSAKTKGSPQLNSFGPCQTLAAELLARGETKAVIRYLELWRKFWKMGGQSIDAWIKSIRDSGATDFLPVCDFGDANQQ